MASKESKIYAAWNEYRSVITQKETSLKGLEIDELISSFFCPGPFYYYIFDFPSLSYSYIHPNLQEIFGKDPGSFYAEDLLSLVHPQDVLHMVNGEKMAFEFIIKNLPLAKRKKYKISYCLRLKTATGAYKLFQQQAVALTLDENGNLGKVLGVHTDISHLTTTNNYKVSFIGLEGEPSYFNLDPLEYLDGIAPSKMPYSKRETEIIKLLAEGFTAKEISDKLSISYATVSTHQKNILAKSDCKNTIELVASCIRDGLI